MCGALMIWKKFEKNYKFIKISVEKQAAAGTYLITLNLVLNFQYKELYNKTGICLTKVYSICRYSLPFWG